MSNPFNEVLIFKTLADTHWEQVQKLERENAELREDKERLIIILKNIIDVADAAMNEANRKGAEWDIKAELAEALAAIDAARKKEQP